MYQVYVKDKETMSKDLVGEYADADDAFDKADELVAQDSTVKYVIEKTSGKFNSYGDLLTDIVAQN